MFAVYKGNMQLCLGLSLTKDERLYKVEVLDEFPRGGTFVFLVLKLFVMCGIHRPVPAQKWTHFTAAAKKTNMFDSLAD